MSDCKLEMYAISDVGKVRTNNEDSYYFNCDNRFMVVCDGMGGHAGGNVASDLATKAITEVLDNLVKEGLPSEDDAIEGMKKAIFLANDVILNEARKNTNLRDMGTTASATLFLNGNAVLGQVGDSRIYRIFDGEIEQITEDHTLVAEKIKSGELDANSHDASLLSSVLTRAVGMENIIVDIFIEETRKDDVYLFCSDGLSDMIDDDEMLQIVTLSKGDLETACQACVKLANQRGGVDNITVSMTKVY